MSTSTCRITDTSFCLASNSLLSSSTSATFSSSSFWVAFIRSTTLNACSSRALNWDMVSSCWVWSLTASVSAFLASFCSLAICFSEFLIWATFFATSASAAATLAWSEATSSRCFLSAAPPTFSMSSSSLATWSRIVRLFFSSSASSFLSPSIDSVRALVRSASSADTAVAALSSGNLSSSSSANVLDDSTSMLDFTMAVSSCFNSFLAALTPAVASATRERASATLLVSSLSSSSALAASSAAFRWSTVLVITGLVPRHMRPPRGLAPPPDMVPFSLIISPLRVTTRRKRLLPE